MRHALIKHFIALPTLLALPALAHGETIEMPPDPVHTEAKVQTKVATVEDAINSTEPTPAVTDKAPEPAVVEKKKDRYIEPFIAIAGGMRLESLHQPDSVDRGTQNPTVAVSRLGVRGGVGEHISFSSEFEAALGGPLGYGASVWEGQAAIAIRDQWVRYKRAGFAIAAGRIADPASFDYTS
ncbi:MAG TPA: hypothetical protein VIV40_01685, partial [Kofleriaceae bacterium]